MRNIMRAHNRIIPLSRVESSILWGLYDASTVATWQHRFDVFQIFCRIVSCSFCLWSNFAQNVISLSVCCSDYLQKISLKQNKINNNGTQWKHNDGWQHKGAMSTKPLFEKIAKIKQSYVRLCGHTKFVLLTPA